MSDFITNGASVLPPVKNDARVPTGSTSEWAADDSNQLRQAALDLRSEIINIVQAGTGAGSTTPITANGSTTARTLGARFADVVNVLDFGAVGNGIADDTSAIQAAATAAAGKVLFFPSLPFYVSGTVTLQTGTRIVGTGAVITQGGSNSAIFFADGETDLSVEGMSFIGVGRTDTSAGTLNAATQGETPTSQAYAIWLNSCQRVTIRDCKVRECRSGGIRLFDPFDVLIENNDMEGTYDSYPGGAGLETGLPAANASYASYGVTIYGSVDLTGAAVGARVVIAKNRISKYGHAIFSGPSIDYLTIDGNYFEKVSQHGFYVYPHHNLVITNNRGDAITGSKVQTYSKNTWTTPTGIRVEGNVLSSGSAPALSVVTSENSALRSSMYCQDVSVQGNVCTSTSHAAIMLSAVRGLRCENNVCHDTAREGILSWNTEGVIANNTVLNCAATSYSPIYIVGSPYLRVRVKGNLVSGCGTIGAQTAYLTFPWGSTNSDPVAWVASSFNSLGVYVQNDTGKVYKCVTAGISAASGGPTGTGTGITDGTATWDYVCALASVDHGTVVIEDNEIIPSAGETGSVPSAAIYFGALNFIFNSNRVGSARTLSVTATPITLIDDGKNVHAGWTASEPFNSRVGEGAAHREFFGINYPGQAGGPPSAYHHKGDIVWNTHPTATSTPLLWVCIGEGTPGTWGSVLPMQQAALQADAAGANPTKAEFDALIDKLVAAGLMSAT